MDTRSWIIDGIVGTSSFVGGGSMWSTQFALAINGVPHLGVSASPAQQRRWWGGRQTPSQLIGLGTGTEVRPLSVSNTCSLPHARDTSIPPRDWLDDADQQLVDRLVAGGTYTDLAGEQRLDGGGPLVFSNGQLHQQLLAYQPS